MTKLRAVLFLADLTERFTLKLSGLLAWPFWTPVLLISSFLGLALGRSDAVMVILTVQTSIDAQATKTLQAHFRAQDERRDALLRENVETLTALVLEVRGMADTLIDMMEGSVRRDRLNAKSNKMILTALESRADFYDFLMKGGVEFDATRKTASRPRRAGKANGRANRTRP